MKLFAASQAVTQTQVALPRWLAILQDGGTAAWDPANVLTSGLLGSDIGIASGPAAGPAEHNAAAWRDAGANGAAHVSTARDASPRSKVGASWRMFPVLPIPIMQRRA